MPCKKHQGINNLVTILIVYVQNLYDKKQRVVKTFDLIDWKGLWVDFLYVPK